MVLKQKINNLVRTKLDIYLGVALWNVTNVIIPKTLPDKTPRLRFFVRVPALVVPLQRPQLVQLLLGEPLPDLGGVPLRALGPRLRPAGRTRVVGSGALEDSTFAAVEREIAKKSLDFTTRFHLDATNVDLMCFANIRQLGAELVQLPEVIVRQLGFVPTSLQRERSKKVTKT